MPRRPGTHIRQGRTSGDPTRLNQNAVKVLAAVKFAPSSVSREEIMQEAHLEREDVERQIQLLLGLHLIVPNTKFPTYPQQGWKVYTEPDKHNMIVQLLREHGLEDPRASRSREALQGYYPSGMDLEGLGRQPNRGRSYPPLAPVIPDLEYKSETMQVMKEFRDDKKPFRPKEFSPEAVEEKKQKWTWIVGKLSTIYQIPTPNIRWGIFSPESWNRDGASYQDDTGQSSSYSPGTNTLFFTGKFSVITLLHEFGHARGFDETDTTIWSTNLGRRIWPVSFSKLQEHSGSHVLTRGDREPRFEG